MHLMQAFWKGFKQGVSTPRVASVFKTDGYVCVHFTDGHAMLFHPHWKNGWSLDGLEIVTLYHNGQMKFYYLGDYYDHGSNSREFSILLLGENYTQQTVARYWKAAIRHVRKLPWEPNRLASYLIFHRGFVIMQALESNEVLYWDPVANERTNLRPQSFVTGPAAS